MRIKIARFKKMEEKLFTFEKIPENPLRIDMVVLKIDRIEKIWKFEKITQKVVKVKNVGENRKN